MFEYKSWRQIPGHTPLGYEAPTSVKDGSGYHDPIYFMSVRLIKKN